MSKFLKLKSKFGGRVLVATNQVAAVTELEDGCTITLTATGEKISVKEGYQTLVNRLTKGDAEAESSEG